MYQADSNRVRFDPSDSTNKKYISDSDLYFICGVLSWDCIKSTTITLNFTYGMKFTNYSPTPSGGGSAGSSPAVSVTPLENYTPLNNPPSPVLNLPNDPDSNPDPFFSDSSSSDSSNSSGSRYIKRKKVHVRKFGVKNVVLTLLNSVPILQTNYLRLRTIQRLRSSKWMRILYSSGLIFWNL